MTRIRMVTEDVRQVAHGLNLTADELGSLPSQLRNIAQSITSSWQGGNSDHFAWEIRHLAEELQMDVSNLQRLSISVENEINEWDNADKNGSRRFNSILEPLPRGVGTLAPAVPTEYKTENWALVKDWEAGVDLTFADKWTSSNGWEQDVDLAAVAKISLISDAYTQERGASSWQLGEADIGGVTGDYVVSRGDVGAAFGLGLDGFSAGIYGEYDVFETSGTAVLGGSLLGLTLSAGGSAGSAQGFLGIKDNSIGASIGASAVSGDVGLGVNIAGANVGLKVGASAGFELGIKLGQESELKAGPFKVGLRFGKAIND